jgi:hypothetical protein
MCGDMDLLIKANGEWWHEGSLIRRESMVKMFSRILWYEAESYFLVTPAEKVRIKVEDVPFQINRCEIESTTEHTIIRLFTSVGDEIVLGQAHTEWLMRDYQHQIRPYVSVRYGMWALIQRHVFYHLVEHARPKIVNGQEHLVISSLGKDFSLGCCE